MRNCAIFVRLLEYHAARIEVLIGLLVAFTFLLLIDLFFLLHLTPIVLSHLLRLSSHAFFSIRQLFVFILFKVLLHCLTFNHVLISVVYLLRHLFYSFYHVIALKLVLLRIIELIVASIILCSFFFVVTEEGFPLYCEAVKFLETF